MHAKPPVAVALARFEDLVARGLRALLEEDGSLELVAVDIEHERLPTVLLAHQPDVAILNFGSLESPSEVRWLRATHPGTHLVLLANHPSGAECAQMLAFGASACLGKATQARDVVNAVHLASRGLQLFPQVDSANEGRDEESELLTLREAEVLGMLRDGHHNAQIAVELQISIETVRTHARNIYRKLGVSSRRELVAARQMATVKTGPWPSRLAAAPRPGSA
jgi:DNA-binding NarL/FixJ family response regulator